MNPLALDQLQVHDQRIIFVLDIAIARENSALIKVHHVQHTSNLMNNDEFLELAIFLLPEIIVTVPSLDLIPEIDSNLEIKILHSEYIQTMFKIYISITKI